MKLVLAVWALGVLIRRTYGRVMDWTVDFGDHISNVPEGACDVPDIIWAPEEIKMLEKKLFSPSENFPFSKLIDSLIKRRKQLREENFSSHENKTKQIRGEQSPRSHYSPFRPAYYLAERQS